jgi:hypothetical protein
MLCTGCYVQDVRYFAIEHMDVRCEAFQFRTNYFMDVRREAFQFRTNYFVDMPCEASQIGKHPRE